MNIEEMFNEFCERFENNSGNESDLFEVMTDAFWSAYDAGVDAGVSLSKTIS